MDMEIKLVNTENGWEARWVKHFNPQMIGLVGTGRNPQEALASLHLEMDITLVMELLTGVM